MVHLFGDTIPSWLTVLIISLFPILENRGGMIAARLLNMNMLQAFIISYLGNLVPIPFILLFIKKIFEWLRKIKGFDKIIKHFEAKAEKNRDKINRGKQWGAFAVRCDSASRNRRLDGRAYGVAFGNTA